MSILDWIGDHVTGPVFGPTLGIGNLSPNTNQNVGGVNLATGQQVQAGNRSDNSGPYGKQGSPGGPQGSVTAPNATGSFAPWLLAFGVLAFLLLLADGGKYHDVAIALAWAVAGGVILTQLPAIMAGLPQLQP